MDLSQIANTVIILLAVVAAYGMYFTTDIILELADDWKELESVDRLYLLIVTIVGFGTTYSAIRLAGEVASIFA